MTQTETMAAGRGGAGIWVFRALVVAGAALMLYSWFAPWWSAKFSAIPGRDHMVLHPWGIEAVGRVRQYSDNSLYDMPAFFAPFVWTYLGVCMLALLVGLFVAKRLTLGPIRVRLASLLIGLVGLSYLATAGIAYGVGMIRAAAADTNFIGRSTVTNENYSGEITMTSQLEIGFWLAIAAGAVLLILALLRGRLASD